MLLENVTVFAPESSFKVSISEGILIFKIFFNSTFRNSFENVKFENDDKTLFKFQSAQKK